MNKRLIILIVVVIIIISGLGYIAIKKFDNNQGAEPNQSVPKEEVKKITKEEAFELIYAKYELPERDLMVIEEREDAYIIKSNSDDTKLYLVNKLNSSISEGELPPVIEGP